MDLLLHQIELLLGEHDLCQLIPGMLRWEISEEFGDLAMREALDAAQLCGITAIVACAARGRRGSCSIHFEMLSQVEGNRITLPRPVAKFPMWQPD